MAGGKGMTKKILLILTIFNFWAMADSAQISKEICKEPPEGFLKFREP